LKLLCIFQGIYIYFRYMDVEPVRGCTRDYVRIYHGRDTDAPVLANVCSNKDVASKQIYAVTSEALVR